MKKNELISENYVIHPRMDVGITVVGAIVGGVVREVIVSTADDGIKNESNFVHSESQYLKIESDELRNKSSLENIEIQSLVA